VYWLALGPSARTSGLGNATRSQALKQTKTCRDSTQENQTLIEGQGNQNRYQRTGERKTCGKNLFAKVLGSYKISVVSVCQSTWPGMLRKSLIERHELLHPDTLSVGKFCRICRLQIKTRSSSLKNLNLLVTVRHLRLKMD